MVTVPRPAPVVAAAVLLIVLGSELLLVALASGYFVIVEGGIVGCINICLVSFLGPCLLTAGNFLRTGIGLLRGTLEDTSHGYGVTGLVGVTGVLASLVSMTWWVWVVRQEPVGLGRPVPVGESQRLFAFLFALWANTAGVLTACVLLRVGEDSYLRWREARLRRPEDAGYEVD